MDTIKNKFSGVIINPGCSLNCVFCGGHSRAPEIQLKKQEIGVYQNLQDFKARGVKGLSISGSDPIEYEKITELIKYIKDEGFTFIQLATNGTRLADPSFLESLISSGLSAIKIPLYGSEKKIHDAVTRTAGSFDDVIEGIKNLIKKAPEIEIKLTCLVLKQNKDDLFNIVDIATEMGIKNLSFSIPCLTEKDDSFYIPLKDLSPYFKKLYNYAFKINNKIMFIEIPFCVFDQFNMKNINNRVSPPALGQYNQPLEVVRTGIPNLPSYRLKKKIPACNDCRAFDYCDGFFVNDINRFGVGEIKPIKSIKAN